MAKLNGQFSKMLEQTWQELGVPRVAGQGLRGRGGDGWGEAGVLGTFEVFVH